MNPLTDQHVEQYLDQLCGQLSKLPAEKQEEVREETQTHLTALIAAYESVGSSSAEAVTAALTQFGNPASIGRRIASECLREAIQQRQAKWLIRLFSMPIFAVALLRLTFGSFSNRYSVIPFDNEPLAVAVFVVISSLWLLLAWRAYLLKRWACALLLAVGWYEIYGIVISCMWYFGRNPQATENPYYYLVPNDWLVILTSTTMISLVTILRRRALRPGV